MKTLLLARHAKSSWDHDVGSDFERPLNTRGMCDAPTMAGRLKARDNSYPDHLLSSSAARAIATARLLATGLDYQPPIEQTTDLYEATSSRILQTVAGLDEQHRIVLLVGHNPGISAVCNELCFRANIAMPSGAIACLDLNIERWCDRYPDCADLRWFDYPKKAV